MLLPSGLQSAHITLQFRLSIFCFTQNADSMLVLTMTQVPYTCRNGKKADEDIVYTRKRSKVYHTIMAEGSRVLKITSSITQQT